LRSCIAQEKQNRALRATLETEKATLARFEMSALHEETSAKNVLHGKFAFKQTARRSPFLARDAPENRRAAGDDAPANAPGASPALQRLLSVDHLDFKTYARHALLADVELLTRCTPASSTLHPEPAPARLCARPSRSLSHGRRVQVPRKPCTGAAQPKGAPARLRRPPRAPARRGCVALLSHFQN